MIERSFNKSSTVTLAAWAVVETDIRTVTAIASTFVMGSRESNDMRVSRALQAGAGRETSNRMAEERTTS